MKLRNPNAQDGSILMPVLVTILIAAALTGAALNLSNHSRRLSQRNDMLAATQAAAEGGLENVFYEWRQWIRTHYGTSLPTTADFLNALPSGHTLDTRLMHFLPPQGKDSARPNYHPGYEDYVFSRLTIHPLDENGQPVTDPDDPPYINVDNVPDRPGIRGVSVQYKVASYAARQSTTGPLEVAIERTIQQTKIPLFQFAIFYNDVLEIHPGAQQVVNGLVHTNGNLYTAHADLQVTGVASMGGNYTQNYAPGDPRLSNPQSNFGAPTYNQGLPTQVPTYNVMDVPADELFDLTDANLNNDSYRELIEKPTSDPDPVEISSRRFYNQAHLKIEVDTSANPPSLKVTRGDTVITSGSFYDAIQSAITHSTIQDNREASKVYLTNVDMQKVGDAVKTLPKHEDPAYGFNGVIYVADISAPENGAPSPNPNGTPMEKAIRLHNGSIIPEGGLTVASNNPVYIQGDYNTGGVGSEVESNKSSPDFTKPFKPGYDPTNSPSAVIADAVMILSNNWNDANSTQSLNSRVATHTTVNAAILSGIVPTNHNNNGKYSGGAENFPRFLENWSNVNFTYYGSMLQLFLSKQFDSPWPGTGGNYYNPPKRRWYFDQGFLTHPPPGRLEAVVYSRGEWEVVKKGPADETVFQTTQY
jgi:hypothetical protein